MRISEDDVKQEFAQSEDDFVSQLVGAAHLMGWLVCHFRPAWSKKGYRTPIQGDKGFPDLVLVKGNTVLFWEVKVKGNKPSPNQLAWLEALKQVTTCQVGVIRPSDWDEAMKMLEKEEKTLNNGDYEHPETKPTVKSGQVIVSVSLCKEDFDTISKYVEMAGQYAEMAGKTVSVVLRDVALHESDLDADLTE